MLKEMETEETRLFFVTFLSLVEFRLEGGHELPASPPPGYAYVQWYFVVVTF